VNQTDIVTQTIQSIMLVVVVIVAYISFKTAIENRANNRLAVQPVWSPPVRRATLTELEIERELLQHHNAARQSQIQQIDMDVAAGLYDHDGACDQYDRYFPDLLMSLTRLIEVNNQRMKYFDMADWLDEKATAKSENCALVVFRTLATEQYRERTRLVEVE
jgi:hypothetical protein